MFEFPDKQPHETIKGLYLDFRKRLASGESVSSATVVGSVAGVVANVTYTGTKVVWDATGGTSGDRVVFTVTATGSLGSVREAEAVMNIVEKP